MHAASAGHALPDVLRHQRQQGRRNPREGLEHRVQRVEGVSAGGIVGHAHPEPVPRAADVPVGQHFGEVTQARGGRRGVQSLEIVGDAAHQVAGERQDVSVEHIGAVGAPRRLVSAHPARVGVGGEEVPGVPQRQEELPDPRTDALLGHDQVPAAQHRTRHQEPAHGVRTVAVEDLAHIGVVPQRLRHLLPVAAQHDAVTGDSGEGRAVEEGGREHVHDIEPAARLPDVLDDEVGGRVLVEPGLVLERIVHLRIRHRAAVEPDVEHVLDAPHRRAARGIVGVRAGELVDVRPVQVDLARLVAREPAEVPLELRE